MAPHTAAQAYARIGVETSVAAANPHRLILMLYDGALRAIAEAESYLDTGNIARKGEAISRAISIIEEGLKASLDMTQGGAIAGHLGELYDYMSRRLLMSSLRQDSAGLAEVARLLGDLRGAWAHIANASIHLMSVVRQARA